MVTFENDDRTRTREARPCSPEARALAEAVLAPIAADRELLRARDAVPAYLPTGTPALETAEEQEAWNDAAESLHGLVSGRSRGA